MGQENRGMTEFELWLKTKFVEQIWVGGHRFKATPTSDVEIDGTLFTEEESKQLYQMLASRNPLTRLNASFLVWERNGVLVGLFLVVAVIMLLIVFVVVRR